MNTIFIITGTVRSGTSAMMRSLGDRGFNLYYDDKKRADENNPHGYYETSNIAKLLNGETNWLSECENKVVKLLPAELLQRLPYSYRYRIIYMIRDPEKVAESWWRYVNFRGLPPQAPQTENAFRELWTERFTNIQKRTLNMLNTDTRFVSHMIVPQAELESFVDSATLFLRDETPIKTSNNPDILQDYSNQLPSVKNQAASLAHGILNEGMAILKNTPSLDDQEITQRLSICHECEHFIPKSKRCSKCGCYLNLKTKLRSQHCPIGKW